MSDFFVTIDRNSCQQYTCTPEKEYQVYAISEKEDPLTHQYNVRLQIKNDKGRSIWIPENQCRMKSFD